MNRKICFVLLFCSYFVFSFGQSAYKLKQQALKSFERRSYKSSLNKFLKAEALGDTLIGSKYKIGICYVALGGYDNANKYFAQLENFMVFDRENVEGNYFGTRSSHCFPDALDEIADIAEINFVKRNYKITINCCKYLCNYYFVDDYSYTRIVETFYTTRKYDRCIAYCESALKNIERFIIKSEVDYFLSYIGLCYFKMKNHAVAVTYFDKIINDENISAKRKSGAYTNKISCLIEMKNYSEAIRVAEEGKLSADYFTKDRRFFKRKKRESRRLLRYQEKHSK